jgi:cytochrome P450
VTDSADLVPLDEDSYYQNPMGLFARLRESRPVARAWMPDFGRVWIITRYADVRAALTDPRLVNKPHLRPDDDRSVPGRVGDVHALLNTDPPEHTRLRRLVQKAFTPRRAAELRPRTAEIAASLLDQLTAGGDVVDLLGDYARPLPITVISELLGIPVTDRGWIWVTVTDYGKGGGELQRVPQELGAYFARLITAKRAEPGNDLLSALVFAHDHAGADGAEAALTTTELLSAAYHLVMAGFDTTVNLIASGTLALLTHPEEMARLRQDPSLLPAAVEELLRFTNPVNHVTARFATEDLPIGDVVIPAGDRVLIATSSADRDPVQFPDPDRLDIGRDSGSHVAFGHGIHYCLGAPLARMEAEVALGALLTRFPGISLAVSPEELRWRPVSLMNGLESLPVRLATDSLVNHGGLTERSPRVAGVDSGGEASGGDVVHVAGDAHLW